MNIRFGKLKVATPKVEKVEVERFNYPVLIMHPAPTEPKGKYRFEFNKAALDMLQLSETEFVEFGFTNEAGELLDAPVMGKFEEGNKVNALGNFFNKQLHEDLHTFFNKEDNVEMLFTLTPKDAYYTLDYFQLVNEVPQVDNCVEEETPTVLDAIEDFFGRVLNPPDGMLDSTKSTKVQDMEPSNEFQVRNY